MMRPYEIFITANIPGTTPKERYDNLITMKQFVMRIAYPGRGTTDERQTLQEYADEIQKQFTRDDLSIKDVP
jgi:hypothetical protein